MHAHRQTDRHIHTHTHIHVCMYVCTHTCTCKMNSVKQVTKRNLKLSKLPLMHNEEEAFNSNMPRDTDTEPLTQTPLNRHRHHQTGPDTIKQAQTPSNRHRHHQQKRCVHFTCLIMMTLPSLWVSTSGPVEESAFFIFGLDVTKLHHFDSSESNHFVELASLLQCQTDSKNIQI